MGAELFGFDPHDPANITGIVRHLTKNERLLSINCLQKNAAAAVTMVFSYII